jgi:hypothetical protein
MSCKAVDNDGWSRVIRDVRVMRQGHEYYSSIFNIVVIVVKDIKGGGDVRLRKRLPGHRTRVQADDNREPSHYSPRSTYLEHKIVVPKKKSRHSISHPALFVGNVHKRQ